MRNANWFSGVIERYPARKLPNTHAASHTRTGVDIIKRQITCQIPFFKPGT